VLHFFVDGFDVLFVGGLGALLQNSKRYSGARDGSAQFMGNVAQKAPLAGHESPELCCHALNRVVQLADFVASANAGLNVEVPFGDLPGGASDFLDGSG
jgi:hypothetical protein